MCAILENGHNFICLSNHNLLKIIIKTTTAGAIQRMYCGNMIIVWKYCKSFTILQARNTNEIGVLHLFIHIRADNAYILVPPSNVTSPEGTRVQLPCVAEAHPNNVTHQWLRDGIDLQLVTGPIYHLSFYFSFLSFSFFSRRKLKSRFLSML